ncbi:MAG TPA: 50S ribosomal protein L16 [Polyangiaceae bacterium]|nr:50S ribosomal protein L16 [Polyangiaceae bacterium]
MLSPKRTKFRKQQKGKIRGVAWRGSDVSFGDFALQSTETCLLTARQIEAGRMAIQRHVKRAGKLWIRVFPDKPITKKPLEVRMGSGKGGVEGWVAVIKPGRVLYEIAGVPEKDAREAFRLAAAKLPLGTKFLARGVL